MFYNSAGSLKIAFATGVFLAMTHTASAQAFSPSYVFSQNGTVGQLYYQSQEYASAAPFLYGCSGDGCSGMEWQERYTQELLKSYSNTVNDALVAEGKSPVGEIPFKMEQEGRLLNRPLEQFPEVDVSALRAQIGNANAQMVAGVAAGVAQKYPALTGTYEKYRDMANELVGGTFFGEGIDDYLRLEDISKEMQSVLGENFMDSASIEDLGNVAAYGVDLGASAPSGASGGMGGGCPCCGDAVSSIPDIDDEASKIIPEETLRVKQTIERFEKILSEYKNIRVGETLSDGLTGAHLSAEALRQTHLKELEHLTLKKEKLALLQQLVSQAKSKSDIDAIELVLQNQ